MIFLIHYFPFYFGRPHTSIRDLEEQSWWPFMEIEFIKLTYCHIHKDSDSAVGVTPNDSGLAKQD